MVLTGEPAFSKRVGLGSSPESEVFLGIRRVIIFLIVSLFLNGLSSVFHFFSLLLSL